MRIRHLVDSSGFGGIESHLTLLVPELAERGHDCRLWLWQDHGSTELPVTTTLEGRLASLINQLRQDQPDILHTHGYKAGVMGRIAGLISRTPVISTFHNGDSGRGRVAVYTSLDRWTSCLSTNIAVSTAIQNQVPQSVVIPNFVQCPAVRPNLPRCDVIGFVGRLDPVKGPDRFIKLAAETDSQAILFGDGPMLSDLTAAATDRINFAGRVAEMKQHWLRLGLLVITSRAEGLPLAALEAMAAGVPVAALGHGALPDLIEDGRNGYLVGPDDLDGLRMRVLQWRQLSNAERLAMSHSAYETVSQRYAIERIIPKIESLYMQAATGQCCISHADADNKLRRINNSI